MYLKILSQNDDQTNILASIQDIEFHHLDTDNNDIETQLSYADRAMISNDLLKTNGQMRVGCFNLTYLSGKTEYIIFDGVAFLCNETGKAVERYLAN